MALAVGVPLKLSVAALNVMPLGRVPDFVTLGAGKPVVSTWKLKLDPTVALATCELVMTGPSLTFSVKVWLDVPVGLVALMVMA